MHYKIKNQPRRLTILVLLAICIGLLAACPNNFLWFRSYDAALAEWNDATLTSYKQQIATTSFIGIKESLTNDLALFESTLDTGSGKRKSDRMYFLKRIAEYTSSVSNFYVVETISQGEEVRGYNYLLFDIAGQTRIVAFVHYNHWSPIKDSTTQKIQLKEPLDNVVLNYDTYRHREADLLVLSEFKKGQPIKSAYIVDGAISQSSSLARLIQIH